MGLREADKPPIPRLAALAPNARAAISDLYHELGGIHPEPRLAPGPWDSGYEGDLVVEFDESQHFNRYRAMTLNTVWAEPLPWRDDYLDYAHRFEGDCIKSRGWGGYWCNASTERMFGPPGPPRDLDGPGSPRWKQRALYDAMRDIAAVSGFGIRLVRLATYDTVGSVQLGMALDGRAPLDPDALRALIDQRTVSS